MKDFTKLIDPDFKWIDECSDIADYIETHLYDTICWQIPTVDIPEDDDGEAMNELHDEAFEQVVAILASRVFRHIDLQK